MSTTFKLKQSLKQTLNLSKSMQSQINMLSLDRLGLSSLLSDIAMTNPFLEYTPSLDISNYIEETISNKPKLQDELYYQLHTCSYNYSDKICSYIIESLNDKGFFTLDINDTCRYLNIKNEEFEKNLKIIQNFEPIGVAAKSSINSICIQLRYKKYEKAAYILENFAKEIENQQLNKIAEKMNISPDELYACFIQIRSCDPFPCSEYSSGHTEFILPEFEVKIEDGNIIIEPKNIGQLSLSNKELSKERDPKIKEYFNQAKFYIDSLNKRNKTLLILSNELITIQKGYFLYNDELKPCGIKDIAQNTGFSLSTVSRMLSKKYYTFNESIYPLKDLFVSSTKQGSSKDSIQKALVYLIENEDKSNPYRDEDLVKLLEDMELFVSRRAISKYRDQLNIPNSKQRKKKL